VKKLGFLNKTIATMQTMACLVVVALSAGAATVDRDYVSVVLLGSTGNLAKKYLWQSLLNIDAGAEQPPYDVLVLPAATKKAAQAQPVVDAALAENVTFPSAAARESFAMKTLPYVRLRSEDDYAAAAAVLREHARARGGRGREIGRLWYLAVPPKFYGGIARNIHAHGRPSDTAAAPTWMRVVFEKPFGSSLASAEALAAVLKESGLREEEIYRVDHYLGKAAVRALLPFRQLNNMAFEIERVATLPASAGTHGDGHAESSIEATAYLENEWHAAAMTPLMLKRVEVAMKETEDCEGRTSFYDAYGVVRDVLQNHLTEIAALALMALPTGEDGDNDPLAAIAEAKASFMRALRWKGTPNTGALVAQYAGYGGHVESDPWSSGAANTTTPTFASVKLASVRAGWEQKKKGAGSEEDAEGSTLVNVPLFLIAGKALDVREAYLRIILEESISKKAHELRVQIQGGKHGTAILASCGLKSLTPPPGWSLKAMTSAEKKEAKAASECWGQRFVPSAALASVSAYERLLRAALSGDSQHFVSTASLLASWGVWSEVIETIDASHADIGSMRESEAAAQIAHPGLCSMSPTALHQYNRAEAPMLCDYSAFEQTLIHGCSMTEHHHGSGEMESEL